MNKHEIYHDVGEGVVIGGAVGLAIGLFGLIFGKDEAAPQIVVKNELPTAEQVEAECRRLELLVALEKARKG